MKPIRISCLKYSVLLVAVVVLILTPAISAQAAPASDGEALIDAAKKGDVAKVKTLLAEGANIDHQDRRGLTALMWASMRGHVPVVEVLLAQGAKVNHQDYHGGTALLEELSRIWTAKHKPRIILVGHSAGANYVSELLNRAGSLPDETRLEIILLAPACDFELLSSGLETE